MDYPKSLPDVALHGGKFTDGTSDGTVPPSRDPAAWANAVTDEILAVITSAGMAPDEADLAQLRKAIDARIAAAIATRVSNKNPRLLKNSESWSSTLNFQTGADHPFNGNDIIVDVDRGNFRIYEAGGTFRGAYIYMPPTAAGVLSRIPTIDAPLTWTATQATTLITLTDAATIAWDGSTAQMAAVTIAASRTLALPTNRRAGALYNLRIGHGAAGTTLAFVSGYYGLSGLTLSAAAGAHDWLTFYCDGALNMYLIAARLDGAGA